MNPAYDEVARLIAILEAVPAPIKVPTLQQKIAPLRATIRLMRTRGISFKDIADLLAEHGIKASPHTVRTYLADEPLRPRRTRRRKAAHAPDVQSATADIEARGEPGDAEASGRATGARPAESPSDGGALDSAAYDRDVASNEAHAGSSRLAAGEPSAQAYPEARAEPAALKAVEMVTSDRPGSSEGRGEKASDSAIGAATNSGAGRDEAANDTAARIAAVLATAPGTKQAPQESGGDASRRRFPRAIPRDQL